MAVCMAQTATVKGFVQQLEQGGFTVTADWEAGTVKVQDGKTVVYSALQKGKNGPWIVRTADSQRIKWN